LNNPGTVLLTIADLSEMEAEIQVDETEVVYIEVGQKAVVKLDAYPDTSFAGIVTEVGNSAIRSLANLGQESVDFKVVVAIQDSIPSIRPGLSASVDIAVAQVEGLSVPIQCLTVRKESDLEKKPSTAEAGEDADSTIAQKDEGKVKDDKEIEGVFVVDNEEARFRRVQVGIAGESHFHVLSGLQMGEKVVSGPFDVINALHDGAAVKIKEKIGAAK
jgi:HlyD family secretion protein